MSISQSVPRVSIGLPVYNGEPFLERTLASVLAQTFSDFELIIADNASTDRTREIVQAYAAVDRRIRYVRHAQNRGATFNYNQVLALATADYFKWIAADDVIRPEFLAQAVAALDASPAAVLAYSKAAFIDDADRVLYRFDDVMQLKSWTATTVARGSQVVQAIFRNGSAANVMVFGLTRTGALRTIRPLGNYFGCDFTIVTELALLGEVIELPAILSFYRRHDKSSSTYKKSPSAAAQQHFLDPTVRSRVWQELQLRRRYLEVLRAIVRARLPRTQRAAIMSAALGFIGRRTLWRAGFEIRTALGRLESTPAQAADTGIGLHWSEFS